MTALHTFWKLRDKVTKLARPRRRDPGYSDPDDPGGPLEQLSVAQLVRELAKEFLQLSDEETRMQKRGQVVLCKAFFDNLGGLI